MSVPDSYVGRLEVNGSADGGYVQELKEALEDTSLEIHEHKDARVLDLFSERID